MYGGQSGCYGIVVYNTKLNGDNAIYGYYEGQEMLFKIGTLEEMKAVKKMHESSERNHKGSTEKLLVGAVLLALIIIVVGFITLPLKAALALMLFCGISVLPAAVIVTANTTIYSDDELMNSMKRMHGCEHAIIHMLTSGKETQAEEIIGGRIYDPECGTAYSGYIIALAAILAGLIIWWPGLIKAFALMVLSILVLLVMILNPKINPFTLLQHPVVQRPTEREAILGEQLINKMRDLENGKVLL